MRNSLLCLVIFILMATVACQTPMGGMSQKQQAAWVNNVYARQYDLYLDQILSPSISVAERQTLKDNPRLITQDMLRTNFSKDEAKVLKTKKETFEKLHPLLVTYNEYIVGGMAVPSNLEYQIVTLINSLLGD
jgi:hypothetical protein